MKKKLFSIMAKDCRWDFYVGTGKGGQNKQKTNSACRCTHIASGAVGNSEDDRSQAQNKKKAFVRMANSETMQKWIRQEASRASGEAAIIEAKIDKELRLNTTTEIKVDGKWTVVEQLPKEPVDE